MSIGRIVVLGRSDLSKGTVTGAYVHRIPRLNYALEECNDAIA